MSDVADTAGSRAVLEEAETRAYEEKTLGFWLYLMTDAVIFALLFATYIVLSMGESLGPTGHDLFSLPHTFGETMLLLFSSATFGLATLSMVEGDRDRVMVWLAVTAVLGAGFVAMEISEFLGMIAQNAGPDRTGYLSAFFTLVGTHGVHVSVGIISILVMIGQLATKGLTKPVASRLYRLGLFWHFLDIVWIGIFSVVYLPGVLG